MPHKCLTWEQKLYFSRYNNNVSNNLFYEVDDITGRPYR